VIRVYDDAGNVIEAHRHKGDLKDTVAIEADRFTLSANLIRKLNRWMFLPTRDDAQHEHGSINVRTIAET
jgi:hypothetical protein